MEVSRATIPVADGGEPYDHWWGYVRRALSVRIWCGSLFLAAIAGVLAQRMLGVSEDTGTQVALAVFVVVFISAVANVDNVMKCPMCRKRVKLGAVACHHCGVYVASDRRA